jgi:putative flippase GtrA
VSLLTRFGDKRSVRFIVVGLLTAILYYAVFYLVVEFNILSISAASAFCYLLAIIFNYITHYTWTFGSSSSHFSVGPKYVAMVGFGLLINWGFMTFLASHYGSEYLLIQFFVLIGIAIFNYILGRFWVF